MEPGRTLPNPPGGRKRPSREQVKSAILRSGYLLEMRVERLLSDEGFATEPNAMYPDPDTGKMRELDLVAQWNTCNAPSEASALVLCECENNALPLVFFGLPPDPERDVDESFLVSGFPLAVYYDGSIPTHLSTVHGFNRELHAYAWPLATQYCTLKEPKSHGADNWMAYHSDEQHGTLEALRQATCHRIELHYKELHSLGVDNLLDPGEWSIAQIYHPLVVLGGEMYFCSTRRGRLSLKRTCHVRLRKQWSGLDPGGKTSVGIDVIAESYVTTYVRSVRNETLRLQDEVGAKADGIKCAIGHLAQELRKVGSTPAALRRVVERHAAWPPPDDLE